MLLHQYGQTLNKKKQKAQKTSKANCETNKLALGKTRKTAQK